jgi:hypothetical protein
MAKNVGEYFVQEFVIGLGLLGDIGVDPEGEILKVLNQAIKAINPSVDFTWMIIIFSILIMIGAIIGAFVMGGWVGIVAVVFAFVGGILINHQFGVWMIVIGILVGLAAPSLKDKI